LSSSSSGWLLCNSPSDLRPVPPIIICISTPPLQPSPNPWVPLGLVNIDTGAEETEVSADVLLKDRGEKQQG
jgi:hypothetical protein